MAHPAFNFDKLGSGFLGSGMGSVECKRRYEENLCDEAERSDVRCKPSLNKVLC